MSGELRSEEGWAPADPVERRRREPKVKAPPVTRLQVLVAGLTRIAIVLVVLGALVAGVALLLVHYSDRTASRAFTLSFLACGAFIALGGFLIGTSGSSADWMPERGFDAEDRARGVNTSIVYGSFGVALIVVGFVLDAKL